MKNPNNNRFLEPPLERTNRGWLVFSFKMFPVFQFLLWNVREFHWLDVLSYIAWVRTLFCSLNWCSYELKIKTIINKMRICQKYEIFYDDSYLKLSIYRCNGTNSWFKYCKMHKRMAFKNLITWEWFKHNGICFYFTINNNLIFDLHNNVLLSITL